MILNYCEYDEDVLKRLKETELEMLKKFDRVCKKHDIKYFACFGTAIGAMRHHGFIPWDDDIDIGIFREDYYKLRNLPDDVWEDLFIGYPDNNVPYLRVCNPKLFKKGTRFCDKLNYDVTIAPTDNKNTDHIPPIWIDIFIHDRVPDYDAVKKIAPKKDRYRHLYRCAKSDHKIETNRGLVTFIFTCFRKLLHYVLICFPSKEQFWMKKYDALSKDEGEYVTNFDTRTYKEMFTSFCKYEDMLPLKYIQFEDFMMPVPNNIEEILHNLYGNYMELPPVEKRVNHAPYILDFGDGINVMDENI